MEAAFGERDRISHAGHNAAGIGIGISEIEDDRRSSATNGSGLSHESKRHHVLEYEEHRERLKHQDQSHPRWLELDLPHPSSPSSPFLSLPLCFSSFLRNWQFLSPIYLFPSVFLCSWVDEWVGDWRYLIN